LSLAQYKPFRGRAAASWDWKHHCCSFKRHSKLADLFLPVTRGRIPSGCAATRHTLPSTKIDAFVFFPQISAAIRELDWTSWLVPENLYPVFRETEMRPNDVRLPANSLAPDEASRSDLDALRKARQDVSHQKLDKWIAAAIAELSDQKRAA
jgi:hypothetical protein